MVVDLAKEHLRRRPSSNPMPRFRDHLSSDCGGSPSMVQTDFITMRSQLAGNAALRPSCAAAFVDWLDEHDGGASQALPTATGRYPPRRKASSSLSPGWHGEKGRPGWAL